jgi:hypothetical protein
MSPDAHVTETRYVPTRIASTRVVIGVASTVSVMVCFALAVMGALLSWLDACDGDGGLPFAARASTAGRMCTSASGDIYFYSQVGLPVVIMVVFGTYAVVRARWSMVLIGVGTSVAVLVAMYAVVASLPHSCSEEQRRTLDPYECETY